MNFSGFNYIDVMMHSDLTISQGCWKHSSIVSLSLLSKIKVMIPTINLQKRVIKNGKEELQRKNEVKKIVEDKDEKFFKTI